MAEDLLEEIESEEAVFEGPQDEGAPSKKPSLLKRIFINKKRLIIIAGVILVLALAGAGAGVFFLGSDEEETLPETAEISEENIEAALDAEPEMVFEDIVVLAPFERLPLKAGSAMSTISLNVSLELTDHTYRKIVITVEDRIRKIVSSQVREMTWLELRSPEGKLKLKYALLKRMNNLFPKVTVRNIYFINFIMQ